MKRIFASVAGTVLGLVALLSFKSHGHAATGGVALPAAGLTPSSAPPTSPALPTSAPPSPTPGSSTPTARTVVGSAVQTNYGVVQVQVTVLGSKITHVSFLQLTAFDGRSQQINGAAGPILLQETLAAQSSHIDTVSGASYTSEGYIQSLQSALDQVGL